MTIKTAISGLLIGQGFRTCLTNEHGVVLDVGNPNGPFSSVLVSFNGRRRWLHPDVLVIPKDWRATS